MKNILCYGDSNTWGFIAGKYNIETMYMERYPRDIRWPGQLQKHLGENYHIIEEGLNGRTTNLDWPIPPNRNGKIQLLPCLYSHAPLHLVILMLGGNDLKYVYQRSASDIADALGELIQIIQTTKYGHDMQAPPKVLLLGYPHISHENAGIFFNDTDLFKGSVEKSKELNVYCSAIATKLSCDYLDLAPHATLSLVDGIHLDENGHTIAAKLIAKKVQEIFTQDGQGSIMDHQNISSADVTIY